MIHTDPAGCAKPRLPTSTGDTLEQKLDIDFDQPYSCGGRQRLLALINTCDGCEMCKAHQVLSARCTDCPLHSTSASSVLFWPFCFLVEACVVCFPYICTCVPSLSGQLVLYPVGWCTNCTIFSLLLRWTLGS